MDEKIEARRRQHWGHLMNAARRHARNRAERMCVVAQRWSYRGLSGWHYAIVDQRSAERVRSFRGRAER